MNGYTDLTKLENNRNCLRRIARHDEIQFSKDSIVNVMERFVKTVNVMDDTILVPCRLMDRQVGDSTDIIPAPAKGSTSNQLTLTSSAHGKRGAVHSKNVHEFLTSSELFNLYNMLNALKNDLLWTGKDESAVDEEEEEYMRVETQRNRMYDMTIGGGGAGDAGKSEVDNASNANNRTATATTTANANANASSTMIGSGSAKGGHVRRPSTASVASIVSISNLSDSESEISNENDSGVESEGHKSDNTPSSSADSISSSEDMQGQMKKKAANVDKATELAQRCRRHLNGLYQCLEQMTEAANYLTARYQSDIGPV